MAIAAVVTAVVAVAGATAGAVESNQSRQEQKHANDQQNRIEAAQAQRANEQAIRQTRIASANVFANAADTGAAGVQVSSGVAGGIGGYQTQSASNVDFTNQLNALNQDRLNALSDANSDQNTGAIITGITGAVGSAGAKIHY